MPSGGVIRLGVVLSELQSPVDCKNKSSLSLSPHQSLSLLTAVCVMPVEMPRLRPSHREGGGGKEREKENLLGNNVHNGGSGRGPMTDVTSPYV